jgi:glyoxylase-like metal-dependent hydrolase (beta-lactamase superfamily II)
MPLQPPGTICPHHGVDITGDSVFPTNGVEFPVNEKEMFFIKRPGGIIDRLTEVLPPKLMGVNAMQSFWPLEGEEIASGGNGAFEWHHEKGHTDNMTGVVNDTGMTAT